MQSQEKGEVIKTEAQRYTLQNEMEVEKITLDKFSKNLEDLSASVAGMESLYRQKLPNIQKLFTEVDTISIADLPQDKGAGGGAEDRARPTSPRSTRRSTSCTSKINTHGRPEHRARPEAEGGDA